VATLWSRPVTDEELADIALVVDEQTDLAVLYYEVERLAARGVISRLLSVDGHLLLSCVATSSGWRFDRRPVEADQSCRLSRFAYCHRRGSELVVESPLAPTRTVLLDPAAAAPIAGLAEPTTVDKLAGELPGWDRRALEAVVEFLVAAKVVDTVGDGEELSGDRAGHLDQSEFHDVLFHARSRRGYHDGPLGATFRFAGSLPPQPAVRPTAWRVHVALPTPDIDRLADEDAPFTRVVESRSSVRAYGPPLRLEEVGHFLYRAARVRSVTAVDPEVGQLYETTSRPYPSGGATYDLELYLTVGSCDGLPPAIYHYDPVEHHLGLVTDERRWVDAMLREAWLACAQQAVPQVLVTLTSRLARLSWKYEAIAYAATLKNVGVLYQTMYLVATAMGLAPCALGSGNSVLFAEATGVDRWAEPSVGEFMLGTRPSSQASDPAS
jgi:SagB-type dehydrogenase family enzyme